MKQQTLAVAADQTFENYRKSTRRYAFLKTMDAIVPWAAYAKSSTRLPQGRQWSPTCSRAGRTCTRQSRVGDWSINRVP